MRQKKYILFDLDGTLTDPARGITEAFRYALSYFNIEVDDVRTLYRVIGPPLMDSFMDFYGFRREEAVLAVQKYREYFSNKGIFENEVYNGIPMLLKELKNMGKTLLVATSKPTVFANRILDHFQLNSFFSYVSGSDLEGLHAQKDQVIQSALHALQIADYSEAVMVGDRAYDILGAKKIGIDAVGVLYGYGSRQELLDAGAQHLAQDTEQLLHLLED